MAKQAFNILNHVSDEAIKETVEKLGNSPLTSTSHNFEKYGPIKILEAATISFNKYHKQAKNLPAVALIEVVLAANRNYNKHVLPNIKRLKKDYPTLVSFTDLNLLIENNSQPEFYKIWGPKDPKKYLTLKNILASIKILKIEQSTLSDYELMNDWANKVNIEQYIKDEIGRHKNIAIATIQHLRMTFGANTVKPDQRVIEVLKNEFGLKNISQINSIRAVEQISCELSIPTLMLDQIFVLYGSGYYNRNEAPILPKSNHQNTLDIAKRLKGYQVDIEIISLSTGLSLEVIANL